MSLYTDLVKIGAEIDHHYSDLYFRADSFSLAVLKRYPREREQSSHFTSNGKPWVEVPFAYEPFWTAVDAVRAEKERDKEAARRQRDRLAHRPPTPKRQREVSA